MRQTDYVILGLLSESPLTGYQIKKIIDARFSFFWSESYGQLYPSLRSLRERGLIDEEVPEGAQGRGRKSYCITGEGLRELKDWLRRPVERDKPSGSDPLKLDFQDQTDDETMIRTFSFQAEHEQDLKTLREYKSELTRLREAHPNHERVLRVIDFGIRSNEAFLGWCRETLDFLEGGNKA
jgi:DNA-binding PadR family transcriptional regulator